MSLVITDENEKLLKSPHLLSGSDIDVLIDNEEIIKRFLLKTKFSYQVELCKGTFRGKEHELYRSMLTIDETIKSLSSIGDAMKKYLISKEK